MRYTLRTLILTITTISITLGAYDIGHRKGRQEAWAEARDHQRVMLKLNAETNETWADLQKMALTNNGVCIIGSSPCENHQSHNWYVNHWMLPKTERLRRDTEENQKWEAKQKPTP